MLIIYLFPLKYTYIVFSASLFCQEYGFVKLPITELSSFQTIFQQNRVERKLCRELSRMIACNCKTLRKQKSKKKN